MLHFDSTIVLKALCRKDFIDLCSIRFVLKLHFSLRHHSLAGAADSHDRQSHTLRQSEVSSVEGIAQQWIALL